MCLLSLTLLIFALSPPLPPAKSLFLKPLFCISPSSRKMNNKPGRHIIKLSLHVITVDPKKERCTTTMLLRPRPEDEYVAVIIGKPHHGKFASSQLLLSRGRRRKRQYALWLHFPRERFILLVIWKRRLRRRRKKQKRLLFSNVVFMARGTMCDQFEASRKATLVRYWQFLLEVELTLLITMSGFKMKI